MKRYKMPKKDMLKGVCWKYALACMLEIPPKRVPNFVTPKCKDPDDQTRLWLKTKFNKGMVYIPINQFLEAEDSNRRNPRGGPSGYSIIIIDTNDEKVVHSAIALDGILCFDSCDSDKDTFTTPLGFYVIYDL